MRLLQALLHDSAPCAILTCQGRREACPTLGCGVPTNPARGKVSALVTLGLVSNGVPLGCFPATFPHTKLADMAFANIVGYGHKSEFGRWG
jgi:hypothetical protein